ncbi:unnamed protein product [Vitrella brassicaformis CCMP3155]|uniref:Uncharacterized protein n=1 Tax=Vitrella brassicaformis (strain CCMP3155) TaxID=1169540 RepID=A0A0G4H0M3_VITBC|nr:unnamed protein product [Vitrella brassicaformis CCMP3155]|eukprot:CEM36964.1 unnamed protein product [Vitrella brassicaformis CCMP3155]
MLMSLTVYVDGRHVEKPVPSAAFVHLTRSTAIPFVGPTTTATARRHLLRLQTTSSQPSLQAAESNAADDAEKVSVFVGIKINGERKHKIFFYKPSGDDLVADLIEPTRKHFRVDTEFDHYKLTKTDGSAVDLDATVRDTLAEGVGTGAAPIIFKFTKPPPTPAPTPPPTRRDLSEEEDLRLRMMRLMPGPWAFLF